MAARGKHGAGTYRKAAFAHWANLAFLAVGGLVSLFEPSALLAIIPLELGVLWVVPDLPGFRMATDKQLDVATMQREREYYMQQLWGLEPLPPKSLGQRLAGLFTEDEEIPLEARVQDRKSESFRSYLEMRRIVAKLHELGDVRGLDISARDFERFEQVINAFLRYKVAQRSLAASLAGQDERKMQKQLSEIQARLEGAAPQLRSVLLEQQRLCQQRLQRLPKIVAMLELFRTRADAIVDQLRNVHSQVLADPGMNVNSFLDDLVERQEILNDPLGALEADQLIDDFLSTPNAAALKAGQRKKQ
ncbi:hypothetical protein [Haliangium ochraceum]|uniref:Uncharacterized protein n=1 Tax=Haliangium ochraceum (strain DSM 14365 / JCM 11303 / SMP-2) TaxID=502025 RepID=D0LVL6_HALO1|nr:hypothetical protein [Haliangium ochraceum]ACY17577.1 hypothetical protein Hoch_5089 [Haliangium ochraceum DSM 14365]